MADRPMIFSGPMVRALLEGRKTQTRRLMKPPYGIFETSPRGLVPVCIRYALGDRIWVKEAWRACYQLDGIRPSQMSEHEPRRMEADGALIEPTCKMVKPGRYRRDRHMTRKFSRLTLHVTGVRVQRVQEISEQDAIAEGIEYHMAGWRAHAGMISYTTAKWAFRHLWSEIHGPDAWEENPWVAAIRFEVERANVDHSRRGGDG